MMVGVRSRRRRGPVARIAVAVGAVLLFVAVTCIAVAAWIAWVMVAMLVALVEGLAQPDRKE